MEREHVYTKSKQSKKCSWVLIKEVINKNKKSVVNQTFMSEGKLLTHKNDIVYHLITIS